jgi:FkbM family methyltransferase
VLINSNDRYFLSFPDCTISSMLYYFKIPECQELSVLRMYAEHNVDTFFDVGANIGLYSVMLGKEFKTIHSFEPNPVAFKRLRTNIFLNDLNIRVNQVGVSKTNGEMFLDTKGEVDPTAHLVDNGKGENRIPVKVITLDYYIEANNINEKIVIKIDVEGGELDVLKGAVKSLSNKQYSIIQYECLNKNNFERIIEFVSKFGYISFYIKDGKFVETNEKISEIDNYYLKASHTYP